MLASDRIGRVLELVKAHGTLRSAELAEMLEVSSMTVRRDLSLLEEQGLVRRVHGGAQAVNKREDSYALRSGEYHDAKVAIGERAAGLVKSGETVYLDAGTTTMEVAKALKHRGLSNLRVVTHAVNIATELSGVADLTVMQVGGEIYRQNYSATGPLALEIIRRFSFERMFLATQGFSAEAGLTESNLLEAEVKRAALAASKWVCVVTDGSKWGRVRFAPVAPLKAANLFITDSRLPPEGRAKLSEIGLEVIAVAPEGGAGHKRRASAKRLLEEANP